MSKNDSKVSKFIPLSVPFFNGKEKEYLNETIDSGWVSSAGPFVKKFESDIAAYVGAKYGIANSSGTASLHIALLESGIGEGDEVVVPTVSFISPVNTVKYVCADPVFMDCDDYLNMDMKKLEEFLKRECEFKDEFTVNKNTRKRVKAVIPVHVFGHPVDIEHLTFLAEKFNLVVIEDAAESLGSYYINGKYKGKMTGTIGDLGCFSFNGNKIITTGGGGMIVSDDEGASTHMRYLTNQAKDDISRSIHNEIGYNYRMNNLQAALGVAQLKNLDNYISVKRKNFNIYKEALNEYKGLKFIQEPDYAHSNYWFYSLIIDEKKCRISRDDLEVKMAGNGIETRPLWYLNHWQKPYRKNAAYKIKKALWYYKEVINIPCSVNLQEHEIQRVVTVLKNLLK